MGTPLCHWAAAGLGCPLLPALALAALAKSALTGWQVLHTVIGNERCATVMIRDSRQVLTARRARGWVIACVLAGWATAAPAQTFYKWTDEGGTVHFSDVPPPQHQGVEERRLAPPPEKPKAAEPEQPATGENPPREAGEPQAEGPARVVVLSHTTPRIGPSAMHVMGRVKNVGGADAQHVVVAISAIDAVQGNPCLREEVAVAPSTLRAGGTGTFDADVDSPCLFGDTSVDVAPIWD